MEKHSPHCVPLNVALHTDTALCVSLRLAMEEDTQIYKPDSLLIQVSQIALSLSNKMT